VTNRAVATSGDYRNFVVLEGRRYSHSIDPRSGFPVVHDLVSVTVVHESAMLADAWATALIVLGAEQAARVAEEQALAVYFIRRDEGGFDGFPTAALEPYLSGRS
jgi:thiamine biosynthesis lipoprotein